MKQTLTKIFAVSVFLLTSNHFVSAQGRLSESRFSHGGFKAALSYGISNPTGLDSLGSSAGRALSLGYGFGDQISLLAVLSGTKPTSGSGVDAKLTFAGAELALQYKIMPNSRIQPYGRIGVGAYVLRDDKTDNMKSGTGLNYALGADYFFSRHFGIGAEVQFKNVKYSKERIGKNGKFEDLVKKLNGDTTAFMVKFTIQ